jgi:hypothetical protein
VGLVDFAPLGKVKGSFPALEKVSQWKQCKTMEKQSVRLKQNKLLFFRFSLFLGFFLKILKQDKQLFLVKI